MNAIGSWKTNGALHFHGLNVFFCNPRPLHVCPRPVAAARPHRRRDRAGGAAPESPVAEECYQSFLSPSRAAGFSLNPKVSLLPSLRRKTLGGGRVSTWPAACASSWTDLDKSVSTSTAHICANAGACGCARLAALCRYTGAGTRGRALPHTHPKLPPG